MKKSDYDIVVIGGSSGSIPVITGIIKALPVDFMLPIVIVIHRKKNVESSLKTTLSATKNIREPEDKDIIEQGVIYLAPQNYHLLVEEEHTFSLDSDELVQFSRPSIDVTFISVAGIYKERTIGIILSGANSDGADGIAAITAHGGLGIAQDPDTAEYPTMPQAAIKSNPDSKVCSVEKIVDILLSI
jgi:two-component system chemotaxis response regulator CheB